MSSPIRDFYNGKSIFVTGSTGFIGKVLIEKILRSCDGIQNLYILLRDKKGKTAEQRWNEFINDKIFEFNDGKAQRNSDKIKPIFGDLSLPYLGIKLKDRQQLIDNVEVVLHVGSYVKFDPPLREAIDHNLLSMIEIIKLCKNIKNLRCLVYTSTVSVMTRLDQTKEVVYPTIVSPENAIEACERLTVEQLKKYRWLMFPDCANTYIVSKTLAEQILIRESDRMNIAIVRPSATNACYSDPVEGWVEGLHGPTSLALFYSLGVLRILFSDPENRLGQVPADFVSNAVLSAGCYASNNSWPKNLRVFNLTTHISNSMTLKNLAETYKTNAYNAPSKRTIRPPSIFFVKDKFMVWFEGIFKHWGFAYIFDFNNRITGLKPKLVGSIDLMLRNVKVANYYVKKEPEFDITNTCYLFDQMTESDKIDFNFDVRAIEWTSYVRNVWLGLRRYMLKESDDEIQQSKELFKSVLRKYRFLNKLWFITILFLIYCAIFLLCLVFNISIPYVSSLNSPRSTMEFIMLLIFPTIVVTGIKIFKYFQF